MFDIAIEHRIGERRIGVSLESAAPLLFLTGASGTGKSSLLNMIAGLITPDAGRIRVSGLTLFDRADRIDLAARERGCGYQFQDNRLFPHLDVAANLGFARHARDRHGEREALIDRLGLRPLLRRSPLNLSGGEARRVALARALLSARNMLLLDEPTASLNPARQEDVRLLIAEWQAKSGLPVIIASHDAADRQSLAGDCIDLDSLHSAL